MSDTIHSTRPFGPRSRFRTVAFALALLAALAGAPTTFARDDGKGQGKDEHDRAHRPKWRMIGHDPANSRNQPFEHRIRPANVDRLALKWTATTTGDVSGTPAVASGAVLRRLWRDSLEARRRDGRRDLVA